MSPVRKPSTSGLRTAAAHPAKDTLREAEAPVVPAPAVKQADKWPARISMTASREMKRDLEAARLEDGIGVTFRLRALIELWQRDPELRVRTAELAAQAKRELR